jgi:hypothetical protein
MARDFTKNIANFMSMGVHKLGPLIGGGSKIAIHCFIKMRSFTVGVNDGGIFSTWYVGNLTGITFRIDGSATSPKFRVGGRSVSTDAFQAQNAVSIIPLEVWISVGGLFDFGAKTIQPYFNGKPEGGGAVTWANTSYTDSTGTAPDWIGTGEGSVAPTLTTAQFDGKIANFTVWKLGSTHPGLSLADWDNLSKWMNPRLIQPGYIVSHFPLNNQTLAGPEYDDVGQLTGTITGNVPMYHEPVYFPEFTPLLDTVSAGGVSTPQRTLTGVGA